MEKKWEVVPYFQRWTELWLQHGLKATSPHAEPWLRYQQETNVESEFLEGGAEYAVEEMGS